ncbi:protein kinase [Streptomyces lunaelactis]|uniref:serine/threonine-protein kinase n=1 Tax=Streptomyces lunaelactis TaxID=1535768 RepID=UPI001585775F|nr:serine/threonine-protein kinase [Streptomyces lunaelactis]NUK54691.1 protein kinase [Streptomyces lunaelactis]NUK68398.1 protein kinase [Streptomyces lunaelactis]
MFSPLTHDDPHELGAYRVMARLGSGGMGTVYLARAASGRTVALKTMHARIAADSAFRTRFRLEVDAARVIGPIHGARVFDADPLAETPWMATEYVLGPPLDDAIALSGPLPEPAVRALGALLCTALAQLHDSDVVHRDLKPSNIMLTVDGPKVIDFGIARAMGDDRLTRTGAAAGTPAFMSPEQATGQDHTSAGDVFALAGVLTYAATGHGPFGTGQPADLLYRVRYADPDLTGVPESLAAVLARCLYKDPADRPTTAELAAQLSTDTTAFAHHLPESLLTETGLRAARVWRAQQHRLSPPVDTSPQAPTTPMSPALSRRKLLTVGGGSVLGVAAAGAGVWAWLGPQNGRDNGKSAGGGKPKPATSATTASPDMDWQVPTSASKATIVPPAPLNFYGIALADDKGVRILDPADGGVEIGTLSKAPAHQCVIDESRLYTCEAPSADDGPLIIGCVTLKNLTPAPVEYKDFNGSLRGTQLLCAVEGTLYLVAGQGTHSGQGLGFRSDQSWFLLAINTKTNKIIWRQPLPRRPETSRRLHFLDAHATDQHLVLQQETSDGKVKLSVRDSRTGNLRWEQPLAVSEPDDVQGMLAVEYDKVYPAAGPLRALNLSDGKEAWKFGRSRRTGPPAVNDLVFAVEEGLGVVALDPFSGELQWEEKGGHGADADLITPPIAFYRFVYSKSPGQLRIINAETGEFRKAYKATGERFFAYMGIPEKVVAVGADFMAAYPVQ